ncbi:ParA family protein [bacterium]|nr:ParA family protein [bacterium]MBU1074193.1 ParA family protein [bacterium]MBU1674807.1 ParA family protein [bacterium]
MQDPHHDDAHAAHDAGLNAWSLPCAHVISLVSQKGGVGKTTSAVNLGACFALSGHRTLVLGTDPSCGVSRSLGYGPQELRGGLREVIISGMPLTQVMHPTDLGNLHLVAPDAWTLAEEEQYKDLMTHQAEAFAAAVHEARAEFDTILIDCPPGFGPETRASLLATDSYLVPVQAEELCRDTLARLMNFIEDYRQAHRLGLSLEGLFMTMTDHRTRMSRQVATRLDTDYDGHLFDCSIPRNTRLTEMALHGKPTVIHDRLSSGSRAYFDLMDEIILRHLDLQDSAEKVDPATVVNSPARPFKKPGTAERSTQCGSSVHPGGLARLMSELASKADGSDEAAGEPAAGEYLFVETEDNESGSRGNGEPDMVSLDDLLDEEERRDADDTESGWGFGDDYYETIN